MNDLATYEGMRAEALLRARRAFRMIWPGLELDDDIAKLWADEMAVFAASVVAFLSGEPEAQENDCG